MMRNLTAILVVLAGLMLQLSYAFAADLSESQEEGLTEEPVPVASSSNSSEKQSSAELSLSEVQPPPLAIRLEIPFESSDKPSKDAEKKYKNQWRKVCKLLGSTLKIGGGPWGSGGFSSFTCKESAPNGSKAKKNSWALVIRKAATDIEIVMLYSGNGSGEPTEMARQQLKYSADYLSFMEDEEFIDLISHSMMDQLPFFMSVQLQKDGDDKALLRTRYPRIGASRERKFGLAEPPKELTFYSLERDERSNLFTSRVVGTAILEKKEPTSESALRKNRGKRNAVQGYAYYKMDESAIKAARAGRIWGHNAKGRARQSAELSKIASVANDKLIESVKSGDLASLLEGGFDFLTNALKDTAASGYIGLRYGKQMLAGDPLLAKTNFFGLLSEVRGGPLGGLRVYYDVLPEAKAEADGFKTSIGWSRLIFGTSIGFNPGIFFDRLDLTPKIGMWSLSATLPSEVDENGKVAAVSDFKFKRQFSFGVEAGAEWTSSFSLVRLWYGFDMALSLGKFGGSAVKSNRFGADSFFDVGPKFGFFGAELKTAVMAFVMYESIDLSSNKSSSKAEAGEISGITYDGGYAGLGLAISW